MRPSRALLFVLALVMPAVACGSDPEPSDPDTVDPVANFVPATKEIGPEGGEIVGTEENRFPGVRLVIPPGALAKTELISLAGVIDETPLPAGAERVGPQVRLLPEGLALAAPARLTLPMDRELRDAFEDPPEACKVWARSGPEWTRLEPVETTADSVTVETSTLTTAATGVFLLSKPSVCSTSLCTLPSADPGTCTSSTGYCVTPVLDPASAIQSIATTSLHVAREGASNFLYYLDVRNGVVTPVRYDIDTRATLRYAPHTPVVSGLMRFSRVQPSVDGSVWAMIGGYGFVRFPQTGASEVFDTNLEPAALVVAPEGPGRPEEVMRFSSILFPGTFNRRYFIRASSRPAQKLFDALLTDGFDAILRLRQVPYDNSSISGAGLFLATTRRALCIGNFIRRVDGSEASTCNPLLEGRGDESRAPITSGDRLLTEIGPTTTQLFNRAGAVCLYALASPASSAAKQVLSTNIDFNGTKTRLTLTEPASSMAYDDGSTLYIVNTSRPEVTILSNGGAKQTLKLTSAKEGTPEYDGMIPRRILQIPKTDELLIFVRGLPDGSKKLVRLRKAS